MIEEDIEFDGTEVEDYRADNLLANPINNKDIMITLKNRRICYGIRDIFFTINPCDDYWLKGVAPIDFRQEVYYTMDKIRTQLKRKQIVVDIHMHFEKSKEGRIHSHGVILGVPESYYPYRGLLDKLSKEIHKVFGKPRLKHSICAQVDWSAANDHTYMCKENYMTPIRIITI